MSRENGVLFPMSPVITWCNDACMYLLSIYPSYSSCPVAKVGSGGTSVFLFSLFGLPFVYATGANLNSLVGLERVFYASHSPIGTHACAWPDIEWANELVFCFYRCTLSTHTVHY